MKFLPVKLLNVAMLLGDRRHEVGRLALVRRKIYFEYSSQFLADGFSISPVRLPLRAGATTPSNDLFDGLFGVFNDSLPDGWGKLLLDRQVRSLGVIPEKLGPLDRLTFVGKYGMGALTYEPSQEATLPSGYLDLDRLSEESAQVLKGEVATIHTDLFSLSGSSGGARPKIMVGISKDRKRFVHGLQELPKGYEHWMIKFNSNLDASDMGATEYAYSLMARDAGLEVMPTMLFPSNSKKSSGYFGVKRFDRVGNQRMHLHSLSGLVDADHTMPSIDYELLLKATYFLTDNVNEVKKAFRIACFNVLSHNRDDHSKNFAFLMDSNREWRLSPAFDLTYSNGPGGEHSTTIMGEGSNPKRSHLISLADQFGLPKKETNEIIDSVQSTIQEWHNYAKKAGVKKATVESIRKVLSKT